MKIVETRKFDIVKIQQLCVQRSWFTCGNADQYRAMFELAMSYDNVTTDSIREVAEVISGYSDRKYFPAGSDALCSAMFDLARCCVSFFTEEV